ncbi:Vacuolar transporter chaperone 4 [Tetrabaena socialis]|uniref:Vacuolar transporter chaperone 4 n=1 Tax=Tetrabaena socialis TaxID=47790 RepID=A0A2J7ZK67_9CHLO|nr:Vacuolar transporter chaperone 4 [Tetrabaena socialis]|eukprot:PNH00668.1 Vacuolar transporter chaperone 4 [Tetrabaena socialis]
MLLLPPTRSAKPRPRTTSSHAPAPAPPPLSTPFAVQSSSLPSPAVPLSNGALASCLSSDLYGGGKYGTTHDAPAGMNGHAKHPPPQPHRQPPSHPPPPSSSGWYGSSPPAPEATVFVERKCHRDAWTGEWSLKERAQLPHPAVPGYLAGAPVAATQADPGVPPEGPQGRASKLLREVQGWLVQRGQEPYLRTEYRRSAFQLSHTNAVRISLDTQLAMSREAGAPRAPGGWCRDTSLAPARDDVVRFPYAVLEIKLQDEDTCPAWVLIAGMAMAPVAMAFMVYALYMYRKRSAQILRRETVRFDDQRGPVLLVLLLLAVLVIAYVLTVKAATRAPWLFRWEDFWASERGPLPTQRCVAVACR